MYGWFKRKLTRKFILLLAGFLALQALQLAAGVIGFSHVGEEASFINSAGKQRLRTLLLLTHTHALAHAVHTRADVRAIGETVDAYSAFYSELDAFRNHRNWLGEWIDSGRVELALQLLDDSRRAWEEELSPLVTATALNPSASQARQALINLENRIPAQIDRIDQAVRILEMDTRHNVRRLIEIVVALLGMSLLLGLIGFAMARHVVTLPLRSLTEATHAIAEGAYDRRLDAESQDELGDLARNFNRMAGALELRSRRVWALNQVAGSITSSTNLREVLDQVMYYGIDAGGTRAAAVVFYDEAERRFKDIHSQGLSDRFVRNMHFRPGGLADQVFTSARPIVSNDRPGAAHKLSQLAREEGLRAFACLPLMSHLDRLGVIYFYRADRDDFTADEMTMLSSFAHLAANAIMNARLYARVENEARTDALTGLHNRRAFDRRLAEEHSRARRYGKPYALALLDIDRFKQVNDTHGHAAGDAVLRRLGRILVEQFRDVDLVARFGGEEFVVILPEISGGTAKSAAERVRSAIAAEAFLLPDGSEIHVTVSIGISCFPNCASDAADAISTADQALYAAKLDGRNRVMLYRETLKARIEKDPDLIVKLLSESLDNVTPIVVAMSTKAPFLRPHSEQVKTVALALARTLNLASAERETLRLAALLHDIGMFAIPDSVLVKSSPLTPEEWAVVKQHPVTGAQWLARVPALGDVAAIVRSHHERFDGKGYPDGLRSAELPRLARVLAVADAYGSMVSDWPGHSALPTQEAINRLRAGAGTQFDPEMVELMVKALAADAAT